jgi:hypothetical protein
MVADQDVFNADNGVDPNGAALPWRWVRVRARTVYGNLSKLMPFAWPNTQAAATVSHYDAETGASEQTSWRYIDSNNEVQCLKDMMLVFWELMLTKFTAAEVQAAIASASVLRPWPTGFPGTPPYEAGK